MPRRDEQSLRPAWVTLGILALQPPLYADDRLAALPSTVLSQLHTAPDQAPDGPLVLEVTLNGISVGPLEFIASNGRLLMPPDTAKALRIGTGTVGAASLDDIPSGRYTIDRQQGSLSIEVPVSALSVLSLAPLSGQSELRLSPETAGAFLNYDANARETRADGRSVPSYGALVSVYAFAPDVTASSSWSYDSVQFGARSSAPVRLDSTATYRPADHETAVSAGDLISIAGTAARPYRFTGLQVGSDHSAEPGWTPIPLPSVAGTAQPTSSIDLYVNGVRTAQMATAGGAFNFVLPAGVVGTGTHLVVTDVTGRAVEIPFVVPRFNLNLVRQGFALWSVGVGMPRFNWGAESSSYLEQPYAYGSLRYGINDRVTASVHAEGGSDIYEAEAELTTLVSNTVGVRASVAGSETSGHSGAFTSGGAVLVLPGDVNIDLSGGFATGSFNDVVSFSGMVFDRQRGITDAFSQPLTRTLSGSISWQPRDRLTLSASYERLTYRGSPATPFASLIATDSLTRDVTLFASATREFEGVLGTSFMMGVTILMGRSTNASVSAGREGGERAGEASFVRPLGQDRGDYGWQATAQRGAFGSYYNGEVELRTGYGIPALGVTSLAGQDQAYLRATGSFGVAAWQPFASDPIQGGLIVADVSQAGVPLLLNGYESVRSGSSGKAVVPVAVTGTPQRIEIADEYLPLTMIAGSTREVVTVRDGSGTVAHFSVHSASHGAIVLLIVDGSVPPPGSTVKIAGTEIPIDKHGRAWVPELPVHGTLTVEVADGRTCEVATGFDGRGGPDIVLGPLNCRTAP